MTGRMFKMIWDYMSHNVSDGTNFIYGWCIKNIHLYLPWRFEMSFQFQYYVCQYLLPALSQEMSEQIQDKCDHSNLFSSYHQAVMQQIYMFKFSSIHKAQLVARFPSILYRCEHYFAMRHIINKLLRLFKIRFTQFFKNLLICTIM